MISLHQFYYSCIIRKNHSKERYGQALSSELYKHKPDLYQAIKYLDCDPIKLRGPKDNPEMWDRFVQYVEKNWYKE